MQRSRALLSQEAFFKSKTFGGVIRKFKHKSEACGGLDMTLAVFSPPKPAPSAPVLYWLSGLTCTEENFITKAAAFQHAAKHGMVLVVPDTSPRGAKIPGEDDAYDFGTGAGFYVDATEQPWAKHYRMYSYITQELPEVVRGLDVGAHQDSPAGVFGHSMGGHGALVAYLRNPNVFKSVSAFAPIVNPSTCPWGIKAFTGYLGNNPAEWAKYDATELIKQFPQSSPRILIDQGTADQFLENQLRPHVFQKACEDAGKAGGLVIHMREGYDHSYYFISSFIESHFAHHAAILSA